MLARSQCRLVAISVISAVAASWALETPSLRTSLAGTGAMSVPVRVGSYGLAISGPAPVAGARLSVTGLATGAVVYTVTANDLSVNGDGTGGVATADQAETDRLWNAIVDNGGAESACGWCKDRWGVSWQITPRALTDGMADPDPAAAKRVFEAMHATVRQQARDPVEIPLMVECVRLWKGLAEQLSRFQQEDGRP